MNAPIVLIVGRQSSQATGIRGEAFGAGQQYMRSLERAGAVPIILPPLPELLDRLPSLLDRVDGVVLHGGGDVSPHRYGEQLSAEQVYGIVHEHDEVELAVVHAALAADMPLLAVCRGLQVLNVALGGTLHQHIGHDDHWLQLRPVDLDPASRTARAMGTIRPTTCHCVHHQALATLGHGLEVVGTSDDIVHAVESRAARWVVGVQWHPEDTAAESAEQQGLFDELVRRSAP